MRAIFFTTCLFFFMGCTSCNSPDAFSVFDFIPSSTKDAEAKGFSKIDFKPLKNDPVSDDLKTSDLYQTQKNDTIINFIFQDEKLITKAIIFRLKNFDSSDLYDNLRKVGDLILNNKKRNPGDAGALRIGKDVYYVMEIQETITLMNRPGVDTTTRPTGPIIEPIRQ